MNIRLKEKTINKFYNDNIKINYNYLIYDDLIKITKEFFGNIKLLHYQGLGMQYKLMKQKVINDNLIGLVLYGASIDELNYHNIFINIYMQDKKTIKLNVKTIMETLLNNYFNILELEQLCIEYINN